MKCVLGYASSRYEKSSIEKYSKYLEAVINLLIAAVDDDITVKQLFINVNNRLHIGSFLSNFFGFRWLKSNE